MLYLDLLLSCLLFRKITKMKIIADGKMSRQLFFLKKLFTFIKIYGKIL